VSLVGTGIAVGLLIVGWLRFGAGEPPEAVSHGGSVSLGLYPAAAPSSSSGSGPPQTPTPAASAPAVNIRVNGASTVAPRPGDAAPTLPSPADFKQYEAYRDNPTAMFGDIVQGTGAAVEAGKTVRVMYRGWLTDGTLFDENYTRNTSFAFIEGERRVIPGWEQGLMGMKVGGKRRLIVPPGNGYGSEGRDPIPPNAVLVFDVELVDVQ
jgi:hypothetical protein